MGSSLDRYSVEAEKYRAAAGYMAAGHQHLYGHGAGSVDPVTAAAAKYLESSGKGFNTSGSSNDGGSQKSSSFLPDLNKSTEGNSYQTGNNNKGSYSDNSVSNGDSAAAKAYLETAKLYMDSKNYAAEVQRAYMDAAAKSIYGDSGKIHDQHNSSSNSDGGGGSSMDGAGPVKGERADGASPPGLHSVSSSPFSNPTALASYYSQAAAAVAGQAANSSAANGAAAAAALSGIVPLSLSQYAPPAGTYPSPGEYRRPLPVIF